MVVKFEDDAELQKKIKREELKVEQVEQFYQEKAWSSKITKLECSESDGEIVLYCTVQIRKKVTLPLSKLFKLGFVEWSQIAHLSDDLGNQELLRSKIKTEISFMVNTAYQMGYITSYKYQMFCTSNNINLRS